MFETTMAAMRQTKWPLQCHDLLLASAVTAGVTEGAMESASVRSFTSSFTYNIG